MIAAYIINIRMPFLKQIPSGYLARAVNGKFVALPAKQGAEFRIVRKV